MSTSDAPRLLRALPSREIQHTSESWLNVEYDPSSPTAFTPAPTNKLLHMSVSTSLVMAMSIAANAGNISFLGPNEIEANVDGWESILECATQIYNKNRPRKSNNGKTLLRRSPFFKRYAGYWFDIRSESGRTFKGLPSVRIRIQSSYTPSLFDRFFNDPKYRRNPLGLGSCTTCRGTPHRAFCRHYRPPIDLNAIETLDSLEESQEEGDGDGESGESEQNADGNGFIVQMMRTTTTTTSTTSTKTVTSTDIGSSEENKAKERDALAGNAGNGANSIPSVHPSTQFLLEKVEEMHRLLSEQTELIAYFSSHMKKHDEELARLRVLALAVPYEGAFADENSSLYL